MCARSWFRGRFPSTSPTSSGRGPSRRRLRPSVLALEGRRLLSTTWTVDNLGDAGSGSGNSGDLRYCIAHADSTTGDNIIDIPAIGTITLSGTQLELNNTSGDPNQTIEIDGPRADLLSVSGNNASRVFQIDAGVTASISGLTITGGDAASGGGLSNQGTATLTDCTLSGNSASGLIGLGGGLINDGGTAILTLTNCTVSGNSAGSGGGGLDNQGTATLTDCTVSGNAAEGLGVGGGLENDGTAALTNTIVAGNTTSPNGGGSASDIQGLAGVSGSYDLIGTGGSGGADQRGQPQPGRRRRSLAGPPR
jgi:hypothetical protein